MLWAADPPPVGLPAHDAETGGPVRVVKGWKYSNLMLLDAYFPAVDASGPGEAG